MARLASKIPNDFKPEGFKWVADKNVPTTRTDATPYKKGENFTAVIDGFLVSDNIEATSVKAYSMEFKIQIIILLRWNLN